MRGKKRSDFAGHRGGRKFSQAEKDSLLVRVVVETCLGKRGTVVLRGGIGNEDALQLEGRGGYPGRGNRRGTKLLKEGWVFSSEGFIVPGQ